jgi:hypothetical protein
MDRLTAKPPSRKIPSVSPLLAKGRTAAARQQFESALNARLILLPTQPHANWQDLDVPGNGRFCRRGPSAGCGGEPQIDRDHAAGLRPPRASQLAEFDAVMLEILAAQHKLPEAEEFGKQSVARFRQILPPRNPRLAAILSGLSWALYRDGKLDQAVHYSARPCPLIPRRMVLPSIRPPRWASALPLACLPQDGGKKPKCLCANTAPHCSPPSMGPTMKSVNGLKAHHSLVNAT